MTLERLLKIVGKGFEVDFVDFTLEPYEEGILEIGWAPKNQTPLRETIHVKFGSFRAQVIIVANIKPLPEQVCSLSYQLTISVSTFLKRVLYIIQWNEVEPNPVFFSEKI